MSSACFWSRTASLEMDRFYVKLLSVLKADKLTDAEAYFCLVAVYFFECAPNCTIKRLLARRLVTFSRSATEYVEVCSRMGSHAPSLTS